MDLRREVGYFNKNVRQYQQVVGEAVLWYEYDTSSTYHPVYDESGRRWKPAITVPVWGVTEQEDEERYTPEGRLPTQTIHFSLLARTAQQVGLSQPRESAPHLNDIIGYDGRYYEISTFNPQGRLRTDLVIRVQGNEIFPGAEFSLDTFPNPGLPTTGLQDTNSSEDLA